MNNSFAQCVFCEIVAGLSPASFVYKDEKVACFMSLQPSRLGECLVIPNKHLDHFTDIPNKLSAHIMIVAQCVGRKMRVVLKPQRVGIVVHGYGVPHAHLIIIPQYSPTDITSGRFAVIRDGNVVFDPSQLPKPSRAELDDYAEKLYMDKVT